MGPAKDTLQPGFKSRREHLPCFSNPMGVRLTAPIF